MFFTVLQNLITLMLLMAIGYAARKVNIINDEITRGLSGILLRVALPGTMIMSMQREFSLELLISGGTVLAVSFAMHFIGPAIGLVICRLAKTPPQQKGVWLFALSFANVAYMGFPFISAVYGESALYYTTMNNVAFNLLVPIFGVFLIKTGLPKNPSGGRKTIVSEAAIATFLGLILFVFSISLPKPVGDALRMAGSMTTPISMLIIGGLLAKMNFLDVFKGAKAYVLCAFRLLVLPLLLFVILRMFIKDSLMLGVIVYLAAMPVAAVTAIYAEQCGGDSLYASRAVFLSTILSLVTLPLMSFLL